MARAPLRMIEVADGYWNIRSPFKVGLLDIGTQASLVRRANGSFVLLDAVPFDDATRSRVNELTGKGERIEAILHLHPFHTVFVRAAHEAFPRAKLYGTARHAQLFPELPWQPERTEEAACHELYAEDFELSVPRGVDFIPANPKLHFSSVLAFHGATRTLHVDDTLLYFVLPWPLRVVRRDLLRFHPTLAKVLQRRPGATADFRAWAAELVERMRTVDNLCAAHAATLRGGANQGASLADRVARAVRGVEGTLRAHERAHEK